MSEKEIIVNKADAGGAGRRFVAHCCDLLILVILGVAIAIVATLVAFFFFNISIKGAGILDKYVGVSSFILCFLYFVHFEQSKWQATPGKRLLKLKVMTEKGKRLSMWEAFVRISLFEIPGISYLLILNILKQNIINPVTLRGATILVMGVIFIWRIIWISTIFFTKNKMGVYEMLSKTRVVWKG